MNVNDTAKVSRVEVIDDSGRAYTVWKDGIRVWCDLQDDGRTLKIFIDGAQEHSKSGDDARDAARYRYLRGDEPGWDLDRWGRSFYGDPEFYPYVVILRGETLEPLHKGELDAAVDRAIATPATLGGSPECHKPGGV